MTRIGIDFGGVIVRNRKLVRDEDTGLAGSDKAAVAQDGVFDAIHEIISKAGPRMQARTRAWLDTVDFFSRTGLEADHVRFCHLARSPSIPRERGCPLSRSFQEWFIVDRWVTALVDIRSLITGCECPISPAFQTFNPKR